MRTHPISEWYYVFSGWLSLHHTDDVRISLSCHGNWFHQCPNQPGKFAYVMSCWKRKFNCLKVNWFYWLPSLRQHGIYIAARFWSIPKTGLFICSLIPSLSVTHQEWHPAKEIDESNRRNVLVELGIKFLLGMFYNCLQQDIPNYKRKYPKAELTSLQILTTTNPSEPDHSLLHQGLQNHYCISHTHFLLVQQHMLSCYCWRSICVSPAFPPRPYQR